MGCGEFLVKYILFFANLFFALAGLSLLGIGISVQLQISAITNIIQGFEIAPISAMVIGGVVFFIAFLGCCGAIRESNCMLVTYAIFMLVLMILKVTLATLLFVKKDAFIDEVPRILTEAFNQNQTTFHDIERAFQCCGTTGANSYITLTNLSLPPSCCESDAAACTPLNSFSGCIEVLQHFYNTYGLVIGIVAIGIGAVELVGVVFGLCLANHARNKSRRNRY